MSMRPMLPTGRRERPINYGNQAVVQGSARVALMNMQRDESTPLLLTIQTQTLEIPDEALGTGDFRPYAHVAWGHGGIDVEADFEITARTRIPLAGSTINVTVFVKSLPLATNDGFVGAPVPPATLARFRGFVTNGTDAEPLYPTRWLTQMGVASGLFVGAASPPAAIVGQQLRLSSFRGHATGAAAGAFLQIFDQSVAPIDGDIPVDEIAINLQTAAGVRADPTGDRGFSLGEQRALVQGLGWAISSTSGVLTIVGGASAFVTAEFQLMN